ncbi:MAG: NADH-quinone oxidoreductase subunit J [Alphaproteobacteria bacterium]|nr:NADH-quinone oxidoreductase subunit J [Alphaproteobacteria bacterium]
MNRLCKLLQDLAFYLFSGITLVSALMVITARNPVHSVFFLILCFFSSAGLFVLLGAEFLAMLLVVVYVGAVAVLFLFVVMMLDMPIPHIKSWFFADLRKFTISGGFLFSYVVIFFCTFYLMLVSFSYAMYFGMGFSGMNPSALSVNPLGALMESFSKFESFSWVEFVMAISSVCVSVFAARMLGSYVLKKTFWASCADFVSQAPVGLIVSLSLLVELFFVINVESNHDFSREMTLFPIPAEEILPNTHALGQVLYTEYLYIFQTAGLILLVAMIGAIVLTRRVRSDAKKQDIYLQTNIKKEDVIEVKNVPFGEGVSTWSR